MSESAKAFEDWCEKTGIRKGLLVSKITVESAWHAAVQWKEQELAKTRTVIEAPPRMCPTCCGFYPTLHPHWTKPCEGRTEPK